MNSDQSQTSAGVIKLGNQIISYRITLCLLFMGRRTPRNCLPVGTKILSLGLVPRGQGELERKGWKLDAELRRQFVAFLVNGDINRGYLRFVAVLLVRGG